MNRAVEATNKNIKKIIEKMKDTYKDWHEKLSFTFHAYRTTIRTSTRATLFSLVYGMEVVVPMEVEIPFLHVLMEKELEDAEWIQARYEQLNLIEKKRLSALCHGQLYQRRMIQAYDKKVYLDSFEKKNGVKKSSPINRILVKNGHQIGKAFIWWRKSFKKIINLNRDGCERFA